MNEALYNELINLAKTDSVAAYGDIAPVLGLSLDDHNHCQEISRLLSEIAYYEHEHKRPMLTSLVINRGQDLTPGDGFFGLAQELGVFNGSSDQSDRISFWANQVTLVHNYWGSE